MKKALALTLILAILSIGVISYTTGAISSEIKKIEFIQKDYVGDISEMDGITVNIRSSLSRKFFWNTKADFKNGKVDFDTKTQYFLKTQDRISNYDYINNVSVMTDFMVMDMQMLEDEKTGTIYEDATELERFMYDFVKESPDTGQFFKTLDLGSLDGYYPLTISIYSQGSGSLGEGATVSTLGKNDLGSEDTLEYRTRKIFSEYFKIPFVEGHKVTFDLQKDKGHLLVMYCDDNSDSLDNIYYGSSMSVFGNNAAYFTLSNRTSGGKLVDTSQIKGGYGIYMIPFENNEKTKMKDYKVEELSTLCKFNEEALISHLSMNSDGTKLNITYELGGKVRLKVVDSETGQEYDDHEIFNVEDEGWCNNYDKGELSMISYNDKMVLLKEDDKGILKEELRVQQDTGIKYFPSFDSTRKDISYENGRLVISGNVNVKPDSEGNINYHTSANNSFYVCVITKEGLKYFGTFENNLDEAGIRELDEANLEWYGYYREDYNFNPGTWDDNSVTINVM